MYPLRPAGAPPEGASNGKRLLLLKPYSKRGRFNNDSTPFLAPPSGEEPRRVQHRPDQKDQQHQPGQVARADTKDLLDQAEGGVAVRAAQEHKIGAAQVVDQGGGQQVQAKDGAYLGQAADVGAEAPRQQQHREQHQHGVDSAGVQVHDVPQGQGLPGGEKQGDRKSTRLNSSHQR